MAKIDIKLKMTFRLWFSALYSYVHNQASIEMYYISRSIIRTSKGRVNGKLKYNELKYHAGRK